MNYKFLFLDFETNGPEPTTCDITEAAWVLYDSRFTKPVISRTYLNKDVQVTDPTAQKITGINLDLCQSYGVSRDIIKNHLVSDIEAFAPHYFVAHNARGFDKIIFDRLTKDEYKESAWVDTMEDFEELTYEEWGTRTLEYMAAKSGFLNPFPHAALFDVMTMAKIFFQQDTCKVVERSQIPTVTVAANVSFQEKDKAKERKYMWENIRGKKYPKKWVKRIKKDYFETEQSNCGFSIAIID